VGLKTNRYGIFRIEEIKRNGKKKHVVMVANTLIEIHNTKDAAVKNAMNLHKAEIAGKKFLKASKKAGITVVRKSIFKVFLKTKKRKGGN